MKTYHYFVSYIFLNNRGHGFGNTEIEANVPWLDMDVIKDAEQVIARKIKADNIVISNFILLRTEEA